MEEQKLKKGTITKEQYDKNVASIQEKAAKREKAYAVAAVVISTIQAVGNALATKLPWPIPAALAVMAGALGAVQIAKIISAPISGTGGSAAGGSAPTQAPSTSFSFNQSEPNNTEKSQPLKTYVLSKDVNTQQQLDKAIIANGTI